MEQELQVVMLPTEKFGVLREYEGRLCLNNIEQFYVGNPQHLYFVSDEGKTIGDYAIYVPDKELKKVTVDIALNPNWKKVIVSSDNSLELPRTEGAEYPMSFTPILPQPPKSFIEEFVKANSDIDTVTIKMTSNSKWKFEWGSGYRGYRCGNCDVWRYSAAPPICKCGNKPKLTDNNEVIIIPPEKSEKTYSKEEVRKLLWEIRNFYHINKDMPYNRLRTPFSVWINQNLK